MEQQAAEAAGAAAQASQEPEPPLPPQPLPGGYASTCVICGCNLMGQRLFHIVSPALAPPPRPRRRRALWYCAAAARPD